jgi:hypothetical protein
MPLDLTPGLVAPENLTKEEREILKQQFGWDGVGPVPTNLAERLAKSGNVVNTSVPGSLEAEIAKLSGAAESSELKGIWNKIEDNEFKLEPVKLDPQDLANHSRRAGAVLQAYVNKQKEKAINSLSEPQNVFQDVLNQAAAEQAQKADQKELSALSPDIADIVRKSEQPPAPEKVSEEPNTPADKRKIRYEKLVKLVDKEDVDNFMIAIITGCDYTKTFKVFGGRMSVTFRQMVGPDEEALFTQLALDRIKNRDKENGLLQGRNITTYRAAAALVSVVIDGKDVVRVPTDKAVVEAVAALTQHFIAAKYQDSDDTPLRGWGIHVSQKMLKTPQWNVVTSCLEDFLTSIPVLTEIATFPDFSNPA